MTTQCELTMEEQMARIAAVEKAYKKMPKKATTTEILAMIAKETGETLAVVRERFMDITKAKA